ncbi:hypothetical protein HDU67_006207 [Dinochytrium kinnereticum]|nr:hypothetical protein HDU67_006207 [Dinochytrium kinnereticum]
MADQPSVSASIPISSSAPITTIASASAPNPASLITSTGVIPQQPPASPTARSSSTSVIPSSTSSQSSSLSSSISLSTAAVPVTVTVVETIIRTESAGLTSSIPPLVASSTSSSMMDPTASPDASSLAQSDGGRGGIPQGLMISLIVIPSLLILFLGGLLASRYWNIRKRAEKEMQMDVEGSGGSRPSTSKPDAATTQLYTAAKKRWLPPLKSLSFGGKVAIPASSSISAPPSLLPTLAQQVSISDTRSDGFLVSPSSTQTHQTSTAIHPNPLIVDRAAFSSSPPPDAQYPLTQTPRAPHSIAPQKSLTESMVLDMYATPDQDIDTFDTSTSLPQRQAARRSTRRSVQSRKSMSTAQRRAVAGGYDGGVMSSGSGEESVEVDDEVGRRRREEKMRKYGSLYTVDGGRSVDTS